MSCGVSGCDVVVASGKKNGQDVTTLPVFFNAAKIISRCNRVEHYAPTQSPRQPCRPAAPPESR
ncbi:hypothetical protein DU445_12990 [Shigella dysenteriae]|uniref:Uncharacterized protein n=1 Tax=Shigella dysenteriae TaxID=622 RepID=A0A2S8DA09_SHIDY|nr:hypothetical protein [Shigella dysenteriae]EFV9745455.1 hypothetical protein [Shigella flexneri]EFY9108463.1 hypothetical protein [Shigella sonnei]EFV8867302.1 hypothetical protein [Shigella dysenteriae]EFV8871347.1 hypothetical protein [Shigella dysenteriae]